MTFISLIEPTPDKWESPAYSLSFELGFITGHRNLPFVFDKALHVFELNITEISVTLATETPRQAAWGIEFIAEGYCVLHLKGSSKLKYGAHLA